ncbi:MAG: N-acetyl-gamma-glutamyl-phosphate reductase [Acidobacteria bacterium]|nr:N-acetyl-gamma-glutamyl-phosphate reductase [Acidobacteriota bacterium]MBV9475624.1 N-acetyl-gamma-glutamyl-phosphate reductase [Acidobacteriota bacterium]
MNIRVVAEREEAPALRAVPLPSPTTQTVAIAGATGYAGAELVRLLARHPHAHVAAALSSETFSLDALLASEADVVFLATPNEVSADVAPELVARGKRVIDLSGAFRLGEPALYPSWYGFAHPHPELLADAVYGLTEWCNGELTRARLVANPGCYPTSVLLALRPITYLIDRAQPVIIDAKSGVTGAGKKSDLAYSFSELFGNFKAYGVGHHKHEPEIRQGLHLGDKTTLVFVPQLLPIARGIFTTMHVGFTNPVSADELRAAYAAAYAHAPLVRVKPQLPELKDVVNTPYADLGFTLLQGGRRAVIVAAIDNLLKGAASQAVQNFNRMCGFAETEGLL